LKEFFVYFIFFSNLVFAFDQEATYLVLNHFDKPLPDIDQSLIDNFNNSSFNFDESVNLLFDDIDSDKNPASKYMDQIKELGTIHHVNYILLNKIKHNNDRIIMEGLLFNTRSGGLVHRRKINVKDYNNGSVNEISLWVGEIRNKIQKQWEEARESIMFLNPEEISYDKTPMGAALRSLAIPGWGQAYSGNSLSAGLWAALELSLSLAFISSYTNYDTSAKSYLQNRKLYNATDDEKEVSAYRASAEKDWDDHVMYSKLAIVLAGSTITGWVSNSVHAWVFGPRPYTNIYQKGLSQTAVPKG
tara:strand:- start:1018 stop:1923 length:906 start_codon:yes stop_codon:yes gene_type:complete